MTTDLNVTRQGPLVTVEIARPPGNLFTLAMCGELTGVLREPPAQTRVLLLRAAGESFCLGRERSAVTAADVYTMAEALAGLNAALVTSELTVVAQVSGDAAGFGVGLAALADVAIAAETARFHFPEAEAGLAPALVLTWLPVALGRRQAFWLTATGEPLSAGEAERAGLINQAVPADQLEAAVTGVTDRLLRQPPSVCGQIKQDLAAFRGLSVTEASARAVDRLALRSLVLHDAHQPT